MYYFHKNEINNDWCYEKLNTKSDATNAIRVHIQHKVLLEQISQEITVMCLKISHNNNRKPQERTQRKDT